MCYNDIKEYFIPQKYIPRCYQQTNEVCNIIPKSEIMVQYLETISVNKFPSHHCFCTSTLVWRNLLSFNKFIL